MKIYVAGPYTGKTEHEIACNVTRAIDAGIALIQKGHSPYVPHLTHWIELRSQETQAGLEYEDYMRIDQDWLDASDGLLYLASSPGADRELSHAKACDKIIFWTIDEVP